MPLPWRWIICIAVSSSTELDCKFSSSGWSTVVPSVVENSHRSVMPYWNFEIVALAERAFLVLFGALPGSRFFAAGEAPMIGAAIFELDLALLDPGFLDFELGEDRLGAGQCQPAVARRKPPQ